MELTHLRPHYSDQIPIQQLVQRRESGSRKKRHTMQTTTPHSTAHRHHKAPPACAMSADTAPGARDVEDDPSAEEALASLEEADALAASDPGIGPSLPPAVSRKRARPPASAAADTPPPIRRHPDGERMHPRRRFRRRESRFRGARGDAPAASSVPRRDEGRAPHDRLRVVGRYRGAQPRASGHVLRREALGRPARAPVSSSGEPRQLRALDRGLARALAARRRSAGVRRRPAVVGLDVGVGASCVYPLIGASLNGWRFVGIDVTDVAVASARANAAGNPAIRHLIEIRDARTFRDSGTSEAEAANDTTQTQTQTQTRTNDSRAAAGSLLLPAILEHETFAFCVCNPPFFDSDRAAGARRRKNPGSDFGGATRRRRSRAASARSPRASSRTASRSAAACTGSRPCAARRRRRSTCAVRWRAGTRASRRCARRCSAKAKPRAGAWRGRSPSTRGPPTTPAATRERKSKSRVVACA